jgi:predicted acetyltransferase
MEINSQFRKLEEHEIKDFIRIGGMAYPHMNLHTTEDLQRVTDKYIKMQQEDPEVNLIGAFREGTMVGGMALYDFLMNFQGIELKVGGVGFVAVDLTHKKERVAKDIISHFIDTYREQKVAMALLYPFRPDFYKQMGFGFGTKLNHYRVKPETLPKTEKKGISYLTEQDKEDVIDCYNRFAAKTHGMIKRSNMEISNIFAPGKHTVVYKSEGRIEGYASFFFKKVSEANSMRNDILIKELVYNDPEAFRQLMNFLHTQLDQIQRIIINTQDESFHYLLKDPRDGSDSNLAPVYHQSNLQGIGLMYRVIHTEELFRQLSQHNFNNQSIKLKLSIEDRFVPENSGPLYVDFAHGRASLGEGSEFDAEIFMDISDFSAMLMGCVEFKELLRMGLAQINNKACSDVVNELFRMPEKPICTTVF